MNENLTNYNEIFQPKIKLELRRWLILFGVCLYM